MEGRGGRGRERKGETIPKRRKVSRECSRKDGPRQYKAELQRLGQEVRTWGRIVGHQTRMMVSQTCFQPITSTDLTER